MRVRVCERGDAEQAAESDPNMLHRSVKEKDRAYLSKRTKRALVSGGGAFNSLLSQRRQEPHLTLAGGA